MPIRGFYHELAFDATFASEGEKQEVLIDGGFGDSLNSTLKGGIQENLAGSKLPGLAYALSR